MVRVFHSVSRVPVIKDTPSEISIPDYPRPHHAKTAKSAAQLVNECISVYIYVWSYGGGPSLPGRSGYGRYLSKYNAAYC